MSEKKAVNPNAVYLGRAITCIRLERGLKRKELAAAAGISYPFLAEIENGKKWPSFPTLDAIAAALRSTNVVVLARAMQIGKDFPVLQNATEAQRDTDCFECGTRHPATRQCWEVTS